MTDTVHDDFKFMMSGLEKGLQVVHITTSSIQDCDINDDIGDVLNNPQLLPFDLLPVRQNSHIVGIIKRGAKYPTTGAIRDCMDHLNESVLISAEMPLLEYINTDPLDRLVLQGTRICGIVTKSDLLKLPVQLLGFSLVTHIETLMSTIIRATGVDKQTWLTYLKEKRYKEITNKLKKLEKQRADPDPLELTYFPDKHDILEHLLEANEKSFNTLLNTEAVEQLKEIHQLRNTVAHLGKDPENEDPIGGFIKRLCLAQAWIKNFQDIQAQQGEREVV